MAGIWCGKIPDLPVWLIISLAITGVAGLLFAQLKRSMPISGLLFASSSSLVIALIGLVYAHFWFTPAPDHLSLWENREVTLQAEVTAKPRITKSGWRAEVEASRIIYNGSAQSASGKTWIYFREGDPLLLHTHDLIEVPVKITRLKTGNASFLNWMLGQGITHLANARAEDLSVKGHRRGLVPALTQLREAIIAKMLEGMDDPATAGFAVALMLGDRSGLDAEVKADFSTAGLMHVLAISGMHVCLILVVLDGMIRMMSRTVRMRRTGEILALCLLIAYGVMSGASPAVMRAVITVSMLLIARMAHLRTHPMNVLAAAAFIQLIGDPSLLWDAGFQLSYAAMGGILLWANPWGAKVKEMVPLLPASITANIGMTLAAQIATLPLILYHFGQFPTYFLLANLLTMNLGTWAVRIGFFSLVFCFIPYVGEVFLGMLDFILFALIQICGFIAELPGATARSISFHDTGFNITFALVIAAVSGYFILRRLRKPKPDDAPGFPEMD